MTAPLLQLEDFAVGYRTGFRVGPVTGSLQPGLYHLAGANGSGKTSLMRVMCGAWRPSQGRCLVMGRDTWREVEARRHIALVTAKAEQPDFMTVDECWRFHATMRGAPDWRGEPIREALGLDGGTVLAHGSSGQRRKAEIVAALAGDPKVLLLDEIFANIDVDARATILGWFETWRASRVILLTGHQLPEIDFDASWTLKVGEGLTL